MSSSFACRIYSFTRVSDGLHENEYDIVASALKWKSIHGYFLITHYYERFAFGHNVIVNTLPTLCALICIVCAAKARDKLCRQTGRKKQ
jgi:hypothetical protein